MSDLRNLIRQFLDAADYSKPAARRLEEALDVLDASPSDEIQALLDLLASYEPGGGELLYGSEDLEEFLRRLESRL